MNRFAAARTTPLVLASTVGPLAIGNVAQSGSESDLINRVGKPLLVDAVKIQCGLYDVANTRVGGSIAVGGASGVGTVLNDLLNVRTPLNATPLPDDLFILTEAPVRALTCRFSIGGVYLTHDFVPVYGLSGGWDLRSSALCAVWQPSCPIYLEDGEFLRPEIRYTSYPAPAILGAGGPVPNSKAAPQIAYACRVLEDEADWLGPDEARALPYVSNYSPAALAMFTAANVQSADSDLMNPFEQDLYVDKMVGNCISQIFDCLIGDLDPTVQALVGASAGPLANIPEIGINVRMEHSRGLSIVKDPTPFSHLFSAVDSVWWMNTKLAPREFFRAFLDVDFTNGKLFNNDTSVVVPSITMHGTFFSNKFGAATDWHRRAREAEARGDVMRIPSGGPQRWRVG